jgi:hypothetical protein
MFYLEANIWILVYPKPVSVVNRLYANDNVGSHFAKHNGVESYVRNNASIQLLYSGGGHSRLVFCWQWYRMAKMAVVA